MGSISIGTTGLTASTKQMDVIGNNLANSSTLGFKASSTQFASILSDSGKLAVGQGVGVSNISTQFSQGSFENTGNATDMAIDGEGFFMVKDTQGGAYYTRAGAFHVNELGYLVDANNYKVQGFTQSSTDADAIEEVTDISLQNIQSAPLASTEISVGANLNEDSGYGDKFNISQPVFDTKGKMHNLSIVFQKTEAEGTWGFDAKLDSILVSDTANQSAVGITFNSAGLLTGLYNSDVSGEVEVTAGAGVLVGTTTINRPGQLYQDATGIVLAKGTTTGAWSVTTPAGYANMTATQVTQVVSGANTEVLKVDLDGLGGADITFNLGPKVTETATVTFAGPLANTNTITIAGRTFTASGAATAANVATAFAGGVAVLGTMSGTLTGYTAAAGAAGITVFTSTTYGTDVTNLTATVSGAPAPTSIVIVPGGTHGWAAADTVTFNVENTVVTLADVDLTFGDLGNGATIGVADGLASNTITWDLTGATAQIITGYASTSVIKALSDNGYSTGDLKSLAVGRDGVISGFFTNGQTSNLGQVVLADFPSTDGLMKVGSYFGATTESGGALINSPGSGSMGEIRSNSLEISNTDVAKEFINMIQAQRAYQASSRVITTADQMLTELMNIKR